MRLRHPLLRVPRCSRLSRFGASLAGAGLFFVAGLAEGDVLINEVDCGSADFVELVNLAPGSVDLSGWELRTFSGPNLDPDPGSFFFPAGTVLGGRDHLVVLEGTGSTPPDTLRTGQNFSFDSTDAIEVVLLDDQGVGRDYVFRRTNTNLINPHIPPTTGFIGILTGTGDSIFRTRGRDLNFASDFIVRASQPSQGQPNPGQHGDDNPFHRVMITEVTWGDPDGLEITNFTTQSIDLSNWFVRWDDGSLKFSGLLGVILAPNETMVVVEPHPSPPVAPGVTVVQALPGLTTASEAFAVALVDDEGIVVDEVRIRSTDGAQPTASLGGFFTGAVRRGLVTGAGGDVGIERLWGLDSDSARDWTEQAQRSLGLESRSSGPLGTDQVFDPGIVVSEVSSGPLGERFVELFHAGTSTVNLEKSALLLGTGSGSFPIVVTPFPSAFDLAPGEFVVLGNGPNPPAEMPANVRYVDLGEFGQFIPFSDSEYEVGLYSLRGEPVDVVRATRVDGELVWTDPRSPSEPFDFTGAVRRATGSATIARLALANDTDSAGDWRGTTVRTMGSPNLGFAGPFPLADRFDVRMNAGPGRAMTAVMNAGSARAGFLHHLLFGVGFTGGTGPLFGLPANAFLFVAPPLTGLLDADGSARVDFPVGSVPPGVLVEAVWVLQDPSSGALTERTAVLLYGS